ncbi:hypothetical protein ACLOJK_023088 [Asimina triloba]
MRKKGERGEEEEQGAREFFYYLSRKEAQLDGAPISLDEVPYRSKRVAVQWVHIGILSSIATTEDVERRTISESDSFGLEMPTSESFRPPITSRPSILRRTVSAHELVVESAWQLHFDDLSYEFKAKLSDRLFRDYLSEILIFAS